MNKLFTKIVDAALGLTMAIGVGVAIGSKSAKVEKADAVSYVKVASYGLSATSAVGTSELTKDKLKERFKNSASTSGDLSDIITEVTATSKTYAGYANYYNFGLKFGGSSANGTFTVSTSKSITRVVVVAAGWGTSDTVKVGSATAQTPGVAYTGTDPLKTLTFDITSATSIQFTFAKRGFIQSIDFYETATTSYSITPTVTHGTSTGDTTIASGGTASVTLVPNSGYKLPASVTVNGATYDYSASTGVVSLSNPSGNVTISATMDVAAQYSIGYSLTGLSASPSPYLMYENEEVNITLSVIDSTKDALPSSVTVANSTGYEYNSTTGIITLHGSQGNVTITASAIAKPAEATETFDFTGSQWTKKYDGDNNLYYEETIDLITLKYEKNTGTAINPDYWNPARVYTNNKVTIAALTGQGAVTTIKSVIFHTVKNGSSSTTSGTNNATKTVIQPTSGAGSIDSAVSNQDVTYTMTGTVTEFTLVPNAQTRWATVEVIYMKDQSDITLNSITATCNAVLVSQTIKPTITFNPQNATNKNVSYAIVENTDSFASVAEDGTITGLGNGTARLRITPEDAHAAAITINVTVNALPNIYGVEVGKKYAMVQNSYELSGIYDSAVPNYGQASSYSGDPAGTFPIRVVNGLYAKTIALQVEINSETKYLSYDSEANGNSLNYVSEINRESSWIFADVDSALVIRNVAVYGRYLAFSSNRFACYQALTESIITPDFIELAEAKTDKEYVQDFVDLYMHMDDYTENKGWCSDGEHSYYLTAKVGYNSIIYGIAAREALWTGDSDFAAAKLRYETWAVKNNDNDPYDGNDTVVDKIDQNKSKIIFESVLGQNSNTVAIIVIISMISVTAIGGYFFLRKRKED